MSEKKRVLRKKINYAVGCGETEKENKGKKSEREENEKRKSARGRLRGEQDTKRAGSVYRVCLNVRKMTRGQSVERAPHTRGAGPLEKKPRIRKD